MRSILSSAICWGGGGEHDRCIVPHGVAVAMARMGYIVLRLCMMNTLPTNPPVGRYMPVNYCTFGEGKKREEGRKRKNRDEEHMKKKKKKREKNRKKRRERQEET